MHLSMENFEWYVWSDEKACGYSHFVLNMIFMIYMHVDAPFYIFIGFMSLFMLWFLYDVYDIGMHDYMTMHDAVYFLYAMIDVPL